MDMMGGDILTFVSPPGSTNRRGHYSYLSLHVWHSGAFVRFPLKKKKRSLMLCEWTQAAVAGVCVCYLAPQRLGILVWLLFFPMISTLNPPSPSFVFQELWWSWSQPAVTMPATLTASSRCSCAHYRRWFGNTWAPSRPTQGSPKPAQVHAWMWT